jgi:hypothetical protein
VFGTSEKEGVSVDVTGEGFSTTAVTTAWMSLNYESCRYLCEGSYINRQRGNSSVDLNPIVCGSFCIVLYPSAVQTTRLNQEQ